MVSAANRRISEPPHVGSYIHGLRCRICQALWMCVLIPGISIAIMACCDAQNAATSNSQPHFAGQAPGEKQAILRQIKGTVGAIDSKRKTLTIKSGERERTFKVTSKSKFTRNGAPASMKDVVAGQPVEVIVKSVYGQPDELAEVNMKSK
ncbi:MAG: hypothetical protein C5B50_26370 [Verrucomicrobia bacterium]|nr:MAG: hypothetical protein C5B50_26370 [Verrucomicrobiota bacterium]